MVNRKFSYSEIRAFNKNQYEGRGLQLKLQKLKAECGIYHDVTAKQRSLLQAEKNAICRNSGNSPIHETYRQAQNPQFDISKRIQRPWVYSAMETTYNAKYKEVDIPLPNTKINRWRSKSAATQRTGNVTLREEMLLGHASTQRTPSASLRRSKSCMPKVTFNDSTLEVHQIPANRSEHECSTQNRENGLSVIHESAFSDDETPNKQIISYENTYPLIVRDTNDTYKMNTNINGIVQESFSIRQTEQETENNFQSSQLHELYNLEKRHDLIMPKLITLPKIYEIEAEASKGAYKRMLQRSIARVSFDLPVSKSVDDQPIDTEYLRHSAKDSIDDRNKNTNKTASTSNALHQPENEVDTDLRQIEKLPKYSKELPDDQSETCQLEKVFENCSPQNQNAIRRSVSMVTGYPSTLVKVAKFSKTEDVLFKGKWIRGYIRPEERYKIDPVILRRKQLNMDNLAKQSDTYLGRINHENMSVDIAFPRTVRNRILQELIDANSSGKSNKPLNPDVEVLATKVEQFLQSVSQYVDNQ